MENKVSIDEKIALTIGLKVNQLRRNELPNLEINQFLNYLYKHKWKKCKPHTFSETVFDIMNIDAESMVIFLSNLAIIESKHHSLADFEDLLR